MSKIFNSTLDKTAGYIFTEEGDITVVNKMTEECLFMGFDKTYRIFKRCFHCDTIGIHFEAFTFWFTYGQNHQ